MQCVALFVLLAGIVVCWSGHALPHSLCCGRACGAVVYRWGPRSHVQRFCERPCVAAFVVLRQCLAERSSTAGGARSYVQRSCAIAVRPFLHLLYFWGVTGCSAMAGNILEQVAATRSLLKALASSAKFKQVSESQRKSLEQLMRSKGPLLTTADWSKVAEELAECSFAAGDKEVLVDLVGAFVSGEAEAPLPEATSSGRPRMQNWEAFPAYLPETDPMNQRRLGG